MNQPDLLTLIQNSRDAAISQVDANANAEWKAVAYQTGYEMAMRYKSFTSEDVWDAMPPSVSTHEPRAMGAVMKRLAKDKVIVASDQFVTSTSVRGHGRPSRVWESLMMQGVI